MINIDFEKILVDEIRAVNPELTEQMAVDRARSLFIRARELFPSQDQNCQYNVASALQDFGAEIVSEALLSEFRIENGAELYKLCEIFQNYTKFPTDYSEKTTAEICKLEAIHNVQDLWDFYIEYNKYKVQHQCKEARFSEADFKTILEILEK